MRARKGFAAALAFTFALLVPWGAPSAGTGGLVGPFYTRGRTIYDGHNRPVILRGVVSEWLDRLPTIEGSNLDSQGLDGLKTWNATFVRVPLGEQYWVSSECLYMSSYASTVDNVVSAITGRGMVALLDLHWSTRRPCWGPGMQSMPDQRSITFWSEVAARYKDNPLVAFELYNEPHDVSWDIWRNGGRVYDGQTDWIAPGMQKLYDVVRNTGARNLVIASGLHWSSDFPPERYTLRGYNIVYGLHDFPCPHDPPPLCPNRADSGSLAWMDRWTPFTRRHPVLLTEFGWPDPMDGTWNRMAIGWAERRGIGWAAFDWGTGVPALQKWGLFTDPVTFAPTSSGLPVQQALLRR